MGDPKWMAVYVCDMAAIIREDTGRTLDEIYQQFINDIDLLVEMFTEYRNETLHDDPRKLATALCVRWGWKGPRKLVVARPDNEE